MISSAEYEQMLKIAKKAKKKGFDYTVFNNECELIAIFRDYRDFLAFDGAAPDGDYRFYNMKGIE